MSTPLDSTARAAIAAGQSGRPLAKTAVSVLSFTHLFAQIPALKFEATGDLVKAREAYILAADAYQRYARASLLHCADYSHRVGSQAGSGAIGSE
jgi:hypothetical protein